MKNCAGENRFTFYYLWQIETSFQNLLTADRNIYKDVVGLILYFKSFPFLDTETWHRKARRSYHSKRIKRHLKGYKITIRKILQ